MHALKRKIPPVFAGLLLGAVMAAPARSQDSTAPPAAISAATLQDLAKDAKNPATTITYDWTASIADAWDLPLGADVSKTIQVGARAKFSGRRVRFLEISARHPAVDSPHADHVGFSRGALALCATCRHGPIAVGAEPGSSELIGGACALTFTS